MLDVFHHPNSLRHDMGPTHLEAPERIRVIDEALKQSELSTNFIQAQLATPKEITRTHQRSLYDLVKASQSRGKYTFTPDTKANKYTFQAALTAVGGSIQTALNTYKRHSFAMLRPPGHHATEDLAMGFCFFNNIAIAINHFKLTKNNRVAILDIDNHHGNGTQDIFYDDPDVLYSSLHAAPNIAFPGTGYPEEVGIGNGEGTTINVPLPYRTSDEDYLFAFDTIIESIVRQFKPDNIFVSLGLDSLSDDPYGSLGLTPKAFLQLGSRIGKLSQALTKSKVGVFLEGGYKYNEMGNATTNFFRGLLYPDHYEQPRLNPSRRIQRVVHSVRAVHRNYWYAI